MSVDVKRVMGDWYVGNVPVRDFVLIICWLQSIYTVLGHLGRPQRQILWTETSLIPDQLIVILSRAWTLMRYVRGVVPVSNIVKATVCLFPCGLFQERQL